jgi:uncharacterized protein YeaO (DUF488 family)
MSAVRHESSHREVTRMDVRIKRAYEPADAADGYRVLIDRLWPRGVTKADASIDEWRHELAPSGDLRRWFGHDPARFVECSKLYVDELRAQEVMLTALRRRARAGRLTLVYGARDEEHNDAVVLRRVLTRGVPRRPD